MNTYRRLPHTVTALQAAEGAPALAKLGRLILESDLRLQAVESLLPPAVRSGVKSGPINDHVWCLLVNSPAIAAKLRQLIPAIDHQLALRNYKALTIRLRVTVQRR